MSDKVSIWYEIKGWADLRVEPLEVVGQTAKTLLVREYNYYDRTDPRSKFNIRRRRMDGKQFDSLEAANADALARLEATVKIREGEVAIARRLLDKWKAAHVTP